MPIVYDNSAYGASAYSTSFTLAHTITSGSGLIGLLGLGLIGLTDRMPTNETYNSDAATNLADSSGVSMDRFRAGYLFPPDSGAYSWAGSAGNWDLLLRQSISFTGVASPTFYRDTDAHEIYAFQPTATVTLTTAPADVVVYWGYAHSQNGAIAGNGTDVHEFGTSVGTYYVHAVLGYKLATSDSTTINITGGWGTDHWKGVWAIALINGPAYGSGPDFPIGLDRGLVGLGAKLRRRQRWGYS